jgi:cytochrome d ubiquinol oxidase subunit II
VLLDGFDLGVGILYNFAPNTAARNLLMNSIAPIWDGNETWLVWAASDCWRPSPGLRHHPARGLFPDPGDAAGLVFRGVAFEFRFRDAEHRTFWDHAFGYGSALATFAQGVVLGAFIQGFEVEGRHFHRRQL